jgi:hypothetical protein
MMAWRIQPSLLLAFVARSPCLCLVGGSCLVSASVSKRCLSSTFSPVFLTNSYLLSNLLSSDTLLSRRTRYSWSYGHLIFSSRGNGGAKVCDAESLLSLLSLLYFSLIRVAHSIRSLTIPLLCRGCMDSLFELRAAKNKSNPNEGDCFIFHYKYLFKLMQDYCNWKPLLRWANGDTR